MDRPSWHLVNGTWLQASGECQWSDLLKLSWQGDHILVELLPSEHASDLLKGGRRAAIEIGGLRDLYQVSCHEMIAERLPRELQIPRAGGGSVRFLAARMMPEVDPMAARPPLRPQVLMAAPGVLRVMARGRVDGKLVAISFMCSAASQSHLAVQVIDDGQSPENRQISAGSVQALIQENPAHARKYLAPLLRRLTGDSHDLFAPGWADVYLAFPVIVPAAEAVEKLEQILPRMNDGDPSVRSEAMQELRSLSSDGVCAAVHLQPEKLYPQQQAMIHDFLRENSRRGVLVTDPTDVAVQRDDAYFLINCLELDDPRIRSAALIELRRVLDRPIEVAADNAKVCAQLAEKLRAELNR